MLSFSSLTPAAFPIASQNINLYPCSIRAAHAPAVGDPSRPPECGHDVIVTDLFLLVTAENPVSDRLLSGIKVKDLGHPKTVLSSRMRE